LENLEKLIIEKFNHFLIQNPNLKNCHIIDLHILHSNKNINTSIFQLLLKEYPKCPFCNSDYSEKNIVLYIFILIKKILYQKYLNIQNIQSL
jgi:hypothetical protein